MIAYKFRSWAAFLVTALMSIGAIAAPASPQSTEWPQYANTEDGHRFSPLTGIRPATVSKVKFAWSKQLGTPVSMEGTPIVKGDTMYVSTGGGAVFALDARTGDTKWSYLYENKDQGKPCCGKDSRGVTLVGDLVVMPTLDAHLVALDAKTGVVRARELGRRLRDHEPAGARRWAPHLRNRRR